MKSHYMAMKMDRPKQGERVKIVGLFDGVVCEDAVITYSGDGVSCYKSLINDKEYSIAHYEHKFCLIISERDKAINEMLRVGEYNASMDYTELSGVEFCGRIYDAGYRKQ